MRRYMFLLVPGAALAVVLAVLAVGCGDDHGPMEMNGGMMSTVPPKAGVIDVHLSNWAVEPAVKTVKAGTVTFRAIHDMGHMHGGEGGDIHDLAVAKKLDDGSFKVLGQVKDLKMGDSKELTLELTPGEYELQCNAVEDLGGGKVVSHIQKGMRTAFTVTG
ncbi:MAG: hypothetical protein DYG91_00355 [Chloroflexi bacterium CFX7]|nr:hypothetical protein [Chloroflexi bacterium CFX7]MCK6563311.1 cupredoxin domain-containing protein [Dehalococcoidia bacterium]